MVRPYSHSLSDDEKLYRSETERSDEAQRDPLPKFAVMLIREGVLNEEEIEALEADVEREVLEATDKALAAAPAGTGFDLQVGVFAGCGSDDERF